MKKIIITISSVILLLLLFLYYINGKVFDKYDDSLKVNNKSNDTLCFWFAPLLSNKDIFDSIKNKDYVPSWILPKTIESYPAPDWKEAIKRVKGGRLYLLDYHAIAMYKNNIVKLDSNVITNILRYEFPLEIEKLDSCKWTIEYK